MEEEEEKGEEGGGRSREEEKGEGKKVKNLAYKNRSIQFKISPPTRKKNFKKFIIVIEVF